MESDGPGATQSGSSSELSQTEIETLDIYSVFFLICSVSLVGYLTVKLVKFLAPKINTAYQLRNGKYRVYIYSLIIICETIRTVGQALQLNGLIQRKEFYDQTFMWILQNGPSLITFTIACVFAYFWHEIYRGFDDSYEEIEKSNKEMRNFLIGLNVVAYLSFAYASVMYLVTSEGGYLIATVAVILLAMSTGTGFLIYHGNKLHNRVMRLIEITSQTLKSSSGFTIMFRITVFCCLVKILNLSAELYVTATNSSSFIQGILNLSDQEFVVILAINAVSCLLGELGLFISLVILLEIHAKKAKNSFIESESQNVTGKRSLMKESVII